jgi:hypothetical protein
VTKREQFKNNCRWEDNIKTEVKEQDMRTWIEFTWYKIGRSGGFAKAVMNILFP